MRHHDRVRRDAVLNLLANVGQSTAEQVQAATGHALDEVKEALEYLVGHGIAHQAARILYDLDVTAVGTLIIVARGTAALDRHVAEAVAARGVTL